MVFIKLILPIVLDIITLSSILIYYNINKNRLTEGRFDVLKSITGIMAVVLGLPYFYLCPDAKYAIFNIAFVIIHVAIYSLIAEFLKCKLDHLRFENQQIINKLIGNDKGE